MYQRNDFIEDEDHQVSFFDCLIIYSRDEKRSLFLDVWRFYIAILSIISSLIGISMGSFMVENSGSPFIVTNGFEVFILIIEISQYIDCLLSFFIEFHDEDRDVFVRDLLEIAKNYGSQGLVFDLLASIPFFAIISNTANVSAKVPEHGYNFLYIVFWLKALRFYKAGKITSNQYVSGLVKNFYKTTRDRTIEQEIQAREDKDETTLRYLRDPKIDRIHLARQVIIVYLFKIVRILLSILLLAFVLGSVWYIYSSVVWDYKDELLKSFQDDDIFIDAYGLANKHAASNGLAVTYFAFTTLSSVGFGDFYPRNSLERLCMIVIFLYSLTVFSAILGYMQDLLAAQDRLDGETGDPELLQRFFGVLVRYNNHLPLKKELIDEFEDYFDFYWANDRLSFIADEAGESILAELPVDVRLQILKQFLFQDFFAEFSRHFELQRKVENPKIKI